MHASPTQAQAALPASSSTAVSHAPAHGENTYDAGLGRSVDGEKAKEGKATKRGDAELDDDRARLRQRLRAAVKGAH